MQMHRLLVVTTALYPYNPMYSHTNSLVANLIISVFVRMLTTNPGVLCSLFFRHVQKVFFNGVFFCLARLRR